MIKLTKRYSDEFLISELHRFASENKRLPTRYDFNKQSSFPSYQTYRRRFTTWNNALILSGLKTDVDHTYWKSLDTLEKWYYLGFIIGDGCIASNCNGDYNKLTIQLAIRDFDWLEIAHKRLGISSNLYIHKTTKQCSFSQTSRQWVLDIAKYHVVPRKTYCAKLPLEFTENEQQAAALILGLFDADGCIYLGKCKGYDVQTFSITGTPDICTNVGYLLHKYIDITNGSLDTRHDTYHCTSWGSKKDVLKIRNFLYQNAELSEVWLKRKHNKFSKV